VGRLGGPKPPPLALLPHLVQLSKNNRRRPETTRHGSHGTSALLYLPLQEKDVFFRAHLLLHKEPDGTGKPARLRNGYPLRRGASVTPALKRRWSTKLDTGPEDGLHSSTAPEGRW
jgi:hypothetical protein